MNKDLVYILIPAFNEANMIAHVIQDIKKHGYDNIVIVDDGSPDNTYAVAKKEDVIVGKHSINRGKGAATQTAMDIAKLFSAEVIVTMDGDGQHLAKDIDALVKPILDKECDVTLGSRFLSRKKIPLTRLIANITGNIITFLLYGVVVNDSQSGFRAYSQKANSLIHTHLDRYEFESEIIQQIQQNKLKYKEIPIDVVYSDYSKNRYNKLKNFTKQTIVNGFRMLFRLVVHSIFS